MPRPTTLHPDAARPQSLLERLSRQHALFERLDELSRRMALLPPDDNEHATEALGDLVSQRQVIVEALVDNDRTLPPGREAWDEALRGEAAPDRDELRLLLESCGELSRAISERDEAIRADLAQRRESIAKELAEIFRGRTANRGYGQHGPASPRFSDQEA